MAWRGAAFSPGGTAAGGTAAGGTAVGGAPTWRDQHRCWQRRRHDGRVRRCRRGRRRRRQPAARTGGNISCTNCVTEGDTTYVFDAAGATYDAQLGSAGYLGYTNDIQHSLNLGVSGLGTFESVRGHGLHQQRRRLLVLILPFDVQGHRHEDARCQRRLTSLAPTRPSYTRRITRRS